MLLSLVLGFTLAIVGPALIRQWRNGALDEDARPPLPATQFPRLAPPTRLAGRPRHPMRPSRPLTAGRHAA